ncbi:hypothetical protein ACFE04_027164 [Oxalis oulophora]
MNFYLLCTVAVCLCIGFCSADSDNLRDYCPAAPTSTKQTIFLNGLPCKNPNTISPSDFKSSDLDEPGDTENFLHSSDRIITASVFSGLNTLGLAIGRTDLDIDGLVMPHSHPRGSEMFFVFKGNVIAGFLDTQNKVFQNSMKAGDVFVYPRGLLHYCFNAGFEEAVIYSVYNSQNPGLVSTGGALFEPDVESVSKMVKNLISLSESQGDNLNNATLVKFLDIYKNRQ